MGDFNARTGTLGDSECNTLNFDDAYSFSTHTLSSNFHVLNRHSSDPEVNTYGKEFVEMCRDNDMCILNGRSKVK